MFIDQYVFNKHLEKSEKVLFVAHKHWACFVPSIINVLFFGFALPWILYYAGFKTNLFLGVIFIWMFIALVRLFYDWIDWYSDIWLFTNMSIIVVEWHGIFSNTSQRIGYDDVEGLSFTIKGFWGTVLQFGDSTLKVISGSHITLKNAQTPKKIELSLMQHQSRYLDDQQMAHSDGLKQLLSQMVADHLRRRK